MISCPSCEFKDNDNTRVFCQNCGARLPKRSEDESQDQEAVTKQEGKKQKESKKLVAKEPRKSKSIHPKSRVWIFDISGTLWMVLRTLVLAAIAAGLIQAIRPPAHVPEPVTPDEHLSSKILGALQDAAANPFARVVTITPENVNVVLASSLSSKATAGVVKFKRMYVTFREAGMDITKEQTYGPFAIYFTLALKQRGGRADMEVSGGRIGRLVIHPLFAWLLTFPFEILQTGFAPQLEIFKSARAIQITPKSAKVDFSGKR